MSIVTLTGENEVGRQNELSRITAAFSAEYGDMGLERLDGEEASYEQLLGAVQSLPFLAGRKLVILRSPSLNKEFFEKFEQFLETVAETNDVVLVEPKLDRRLKYYKQLKKLTDFKEYGVLDSPALARYLVDYAKSQGGSLTSGSARALVDRLGTNQLALTHEVDKLLAYSPEITRQTIELLTEKAPASSMFELLDAAFAGNAKRAMELYREQRAMQVEPQQIIAMLVWQLHVLAIVKTAGQRSADAVAREAGISPYTANKTQHLARRITLSQLKKLVSDLRLFDTRLKSEALNADEVVQYYLLSLTR